ncbi:hypothetical protein BDSB_11395 [Burkholderia dolosa PC543]|nr:hypothetical protein BDSB_11395 [Burkholderia dolosa PC543]
MPSDFHTGVCDAGEKAEKAEEAGKKRRTETGAPSRSAVRQRDAGTDNFGRIRA